MADESTNFTHAVRTRWIDSDALGHVNNAVFLTYLEEARDAWFTKHLGSREVYVVARIEIDFLRELPLRARDVIVEISLADIGRRSIVLIETAREDGGELVVRSTTTVVRWDMASHRTVELTDSERVALQELRAG
jgi:acyl-CoA thioester hydrolase